MLVQPVAHAAFEDSGSGFEVGDQLCGRAGAYCGGDDAALLDLLCDVL